MFNEKKSSIKGFLAAKLLFLFDSSKKKTKKVCFLMKNQKIRTKTPCKIPHAESIVNFYNKACTANLSPLPSKLRKFCDHFLILPYFLYSIPLFSLPLDGGNGVRGNYISADFVTIFAGKGVQSALLEPNCKLIFHSITLKI